jgi:hypothetical protein
MSTSSNGVGIATFGGDRNRADCRDDLITLIGWHYQLHRVNISKAEYSAWCALPAINLKAL